MQNTSKTISFSLNSLKDFNNGQLAVAVLNKINEYGKELMPTKFGCNTPLRRKYNPSDISDVVEIWLNREGNKEFVDYSESHLLMFGKYVSYLMHWRKSNQVMFNFLILSVSFDYFKTKEKLDKFLSLCKELIILVDPVYGEVANENFPEANKPIDLRTRLPEINWFTIFGEPYIKMFGREKLLNTPCHKVEAINEKFITLQSIENVFDPIPSTVRSAIKMHLGEDAFVEEGKIAKNYKYGKVPEFDFSEVMFDNTKPIIEPQIRKRHSNN